jgi:proteasome lid subunit RPN8/RPN11
MRTTTNEAPTQAATTNEAPTQAATSQRKRRRATVPTQVRVLREALTPYIDVAHLRRLAASGTDLHAALVGDNPPPEVLALLDTLATLLRPTAREQIRSPADVAALLMVEMSHLDQEELRVVNLDTKNRIQRIGTVYKGSVNTAMVRIGEIFKEAIRLNSTAIIVVHCHPSGDPNPSPEDILVTRQIVEAGKLLDVETLDHIVIGRGRWVSMRERGLGFSA